jgi:hypothetical protein
VRWSHSGGFALGAATAVYLVPAEQLGIVVLTNAAPIGAPEALALSFLDLALGGQITRDWPTVLAPFFAAMAASPYNHGIDYARPPADQRPPLPAASYVGTYTNDLYGDAEVVSDGDGLALRLGPAQTVFPLQHYDRDVFSYLPAGENASGLSGVTFQIGPSQTASSVTLDNLDLNGQGTFTRASDAR